MNRPPLVSIITIFLNEERFLQESIESVLAQTNDSWELLLVDDGSTDSSAGIAQRFATGYPNKIRYLEHEHHRNQGKSLSRNLGIQAARGEFIALLDGDDVFLPEKLERQVAILNSHPSAAMVYGPTCYWYSWRTASGDGERDRQAELGVVPNTLFSPPFLLRLFLQNEGIVPATCGLLVRRQVAIEIGGFDEAVHDLFEDQVFIAKVCMRFPVFVESGCWDKYRQRPDSTSNIAISTRRYHRWAPNPSHLAFLCWLRDYLVKERIDDGELQKVLHRKFRPYRHPLLYGLKRFVCKHLPWKSKRRKSRSTASTGGKAFS